VFEAEIERVNGLRLQELAAEVIVSWRGRLEDHLATRLGRAAGEQNAVGRVLGGESL
jgi:hypothetical protein